MGNNSLATVSSNVFVQLVSDSGLLSPIEIDNVIETSDSGSPVTTGDELAARFVSLGKLTAFQANALLEQRLQDVRIGNYEVLERLGAGAMGTVYKAMHRRMKRIVAIKVLSRAIATQNFIERFQREVETLAQLNHPNIIMAFDADEAEIGHYLVMELVTGRDLAAIVYKDGKLPVSEAVDIILQAARGLEYAHARHIVHRDIKPANMLRGSDGVVKVADLGLARLIEGSSSAGATSVTQAGTIIGTADYMPPEQAVDSTMIDHRVDIYSLGCTLFFLLNGRAPYQGHTVLSVLLKHRDDPIPNLCESNPEVPAELNTLFQGMLAKQPEHRTASMTEVVKALEHIRATLAGTPTAAPRDAHKEIRDLAVVLVEPSRTQAGIMRRHLQEVGVEKIQVAASGKEARELAAQCKADVVISALHLDDMSGIQLVKILRSDAYLANIGFILATSGSEAENLGELRTLPRTVVMAKPFDAKKLAVAVAEVAQ